MRVKGFPGRLFEQRIEVIGVIAEFFGNRAVIDFAERRGFQVVCYPGAKPLGRAPRFVPCGACLA